MEGPEAMAEVFREIQNELNEIYKEFQTLSEELTVAAKKGTMALYNAHSVHPQLYPEIGSHFLNWSRDENHELSAQPPSDLVTFAQAVENLNAKSKSQSCIIYSHLWVEGVRNGITNVIFAYWLLNGSLASLDYVAASTKLDLVSRTENETTFGMTYEDYLYALTGFISELSRLAYNSVTAVARGDFEKSFEVPFNIHRFLKDLQALFQTLNLRNDGLRRKVDAIKYDVKNVEAITYDIALRGLRTKS